VKSRDKNNLHPAIKGLRVVIALAVSMAVAVFRVGFR
jgi:hypothetical protein